MAVNTGFWTELNRNMEVGNKARLATLAAMFFVRSCMRMSVKTICICGNLSSPGVKTVLKIKRYVQRLTQDIWEMEAPGDGLLFELNNHKTDTQNKSCKKIQFLVFT